jgi:hypothetical protein
MGIDVVVMGQIRLDELRRDLGQDPFGNERGRFALPIGMFPIEQDLTLRIQSPSVQRDPSVHQQADQILVIGFSIAHGWRRFSRPWMHGRHRDRCQTMLAACRLPSSIRVVSNRRPAVRRVPPHAAWSFTAHPQDCRHHPFVADTRCPLTHWSRTARGRTSLNSTKGVSGCPHGLSTGIATGGVSNVAAARTGQAHTSAPWRLAVLQRQASRGHGAPLQSVVVGRDRPAGGRVEQGARRCGLCSMLSGCRAVVCFELTAPTIGCVDAQRALSGRGRVSCQQRSDTPDSPSHPNRGSPGCRASGGSRPFAPPGPGPRAARARRRRRGCGSGRG